MGAPGRGSELAEGFRLWGVVLGLAAGVAGYLFGSFVGHQLATGFRFDWFVYAPDALPASERVALAAGLAAASLACVIAPVAAGIAYLVFGRRARRGGVRVAPGARARDTHTLLTTLGLALGLFALVGALAYAALTLNGIERVSVEGAPVVLSAAGALGGFLAGYLAHAPTGRALAAGRVRLDNGGTTVFGKLAVACQRHNKATLAILVTTTVVLGFGLDHIHTDVDVADVLPRGNPHTEAAKNLTTKFKSTFTQQVTFQLHVDETGNLWKTDNGRLPHRQTPENSMNVSDEVYVRATDELMEFVKNYRREDGTTSPFVGSVAMSDFYRLINWTLEGGTSATNTAGDESFQLPPLTPEGESRYALVNRTVFAAIYSTVDAVASPSWTQTAALLNVAPDTDLSSKEIGLWALEVRDAYVEWASTNQDAYKVFTGENAPRFSVDLPIANAHSSELAAKDFKRLLPFIAAFIVLNLFLAFRSPAPIFVAFGALAMAVVWTFGMMGFLDIPLNTLNLTVVALIIGVGIDYGIHTMNEYVEHKSRGRTDKEAFMAVGSRGLVALFIATLTTVSGLLIMVVSPSLLIAQLGLLSALAMVSCYLMCVTFIPAALSLWKVEVKPTEFRPSFLMARLARGVSGHRVLVILAILVLCGAAYAGTARLTKEEFGDPPRNWLDDDPLRQEHEAAIKGFYETTTDDVKANILIFEGDIADPAAHKYMDAVEARLKTKDRVIDDTLRTLPFLVRTYLTVRDGGPGAVGFLGSEALSQQFQNPDLDPYPGTRAEIQSILDELPDTPLRGFAALFYDFPEDDMAIMLFSAKAASYEEAEEVWRQVVVEALAEAEETAPRPEGLKVHMFGNTAINYLFIAEELPWVYYMSAATMLLVMVFVAVTTRSWRPTAAVGALNVITSLWWLALLPSFGIGLAITLTLPLVFIYAIGSDYGLHLVVGIEKTKDPEGTFMTTGKAVLFSAITTFGAFLIYTQVSNLAVRRTMVATALAIPLIFVVTVLIVPLFYPVKRKKPGAAVEADVADSREVPVTGRSEPVPAEHP